MADHPDITDDEIKRASAEYIRTGSYTAAAALIGRDRRATARAIQRSNEPVRAQVIARALETAFLTTAKATARTAIQLRRDAKKAKKGSERANVAFALNDAARTLNAMRTSHAKLTGTHAPEKHQHRVDVGKLSDADLDAELHTFAARDAHPGGEGAAGAPPAGEGAAGGGAGAGDDVDGEEATES